MTFYNFYTPAPKYSPENSTNSYPLVTTTSCSTIAGPAAASNATNREVSFNFSESFFQIPASLEGEEATESSPQADVSVFCVPETQYTPKEETELVANMTADQSVLLPSLSLILEESLRTVEGQRRRPKSTSYSSNFQNNQNQKNMAANFTHYEADSYYQNGNINNAMPQQHRIMDKLDMPSQQLRSPLLVGNHRGGAVEQQRKLIEEDSLILQLNSSVLYENEKLSLPSLELMGTNQSLINQENDLKFSLDFLNTPPNNHDQQLQLQPDNNNGAHDRVSTQILLQNMMDLSSNFNAEISLLSINEENNNDDKNSDSNSKDNTRKPPHFDPLNIIPNSPTERDDGHDAIFFPASFDESNNPFSYNYQDEKVHENDNYNFNNHDDTTILTSQMINESKSNNTTTALQPPMIIPIIDLNPILLSTRKQNSDTNFDGSGCSGSSAIKLNPLIIKSTSTSSMTPLKPRSLLSLSNDSVSNSNSTSTPNAAAVSAPAPIVIPSSIKKTLGIAPLSATTAANGSNFLSKARKALSCNSLAKQVISSSAAACVASSQMTTPIKAPKDKDGEVKYLEHMLKTEKKKISVIQAEPRKTPIAGISISTAANSSSQIINTTTPLRMKVSKSNSSIILPNTTNTDVEKENLGRKERSKINSNVGGIDLISLKSPHPLSTSTLLTTSSPCKSDTSKRSPKTIANFECVNNLNFRENQWVFFKDDTTLSLYSTASVLGKTSKTRDLWRVKQSIGTEFTVPSVEMCPVAFLRPFDEFLSKSSQKKYKFKKFNSQNPTMLECYDCECSSTDDYQAAVEMVKMTRISIERETFTRIRNRFERGCLEDSQIRDQIMNMRLLEGDASTSKTANMKFLITLGDNQEDTLLKVKYTKLIESHGGELMLNIPTDPEISVNKIYLLSNGFRRTAKFMTAIIRGIPRVNFSWIDDCCTRDCFIDLNSNCSGSVYLIEPPSGTKPIGVLFKGKKFYLDGSSKFKNSWVPVLRMLGGTVGNSPSALAYSSTAPTIVTLSENLKEMKAGAEDCVVNIDWLIRSIVEKSLTFL